MWDGQKLSVETGEQSEPQDFTTERGDPLQSTRLGKRGGASGLEFATGSSL